MIPEESYSLGDLNEYIQDLYRKITCLGQTFISTDANNALTIGSDGKFYIAIGSAIIVSADAGNDITEGADGGAFLDLASYLTETSTSALSNKTINMSSNTLTGTLAQFNTALSDGDFATLAGTEVLTGKTINMSSNTLTGTLAQFNTALSDENFASLGGSETLTNKWIQYRIGTTTSSATPTINTDTVDEYHITAQTAAITSFSTNLSGTPVNGQELIIVVKGTASRAITWGSSFAATDEVALPTTTDGTKALVVKFKIIGSVSTTVWQCMAVLNAGS